VIGAGVLGAPRFVGASEADQAAPGFSGSDAAFMQGRMKVAGNVAKLMALLPLTNSPEYKQLQEQVREMSEF
jgi:hypothetical protein